MLFLVLSLAMLGSGVGGIGTASAVTTMAPAAAAAPKFEAATKAVGLTYQGGKGHPTDVYAGTWKNGGLAFCIDFSLTSPNNAGTDKISGNVPGMSSGDSERAKHIVNKYAATKSPKKAAYAQLAIWVLEGEREFEKWYATKSVPKDDKKAVEAVLADSEQHAPYRMSVTADKVLVGQKGTGTVKVLAGNGKAASDRLVKLSATGAEIKTVAGDGGKEGTTSSSGMKYTYERSETGKVRLEAVLSAPSSAVAWVSITKAGHQRTLGGTAVESAVASYGYDKTAGEPSVSTKCDTDCEGVATLVFEVCNPAGADAVKWTYKAGTDVVATLPAAGGKCASTKAEAADGKQISTSYCYTDSVGGSCATDTVESAGLYEVVCPAWALATYELPCACDADDGGTVTFTSPAASPRYYRGFVTVTAAKKTTVRKLDLVNGEPGKIALGAMPTGGKVTISFTAYRDSARADQLGETCVLQTVAIGDAA